jgi:hypothetical protein
VGLNGTGSTTHPPGLRNQVLKIISRHRVPNPDQVLSDPNTAVVYVSGYVPPGSLPGEPFDLVLMAAPGTQATSLEGGVLMKAELARTEAVRTGTAMGSVLATGEGEVFVSPFVVESRPASVPRNAGGLRPIAPTPDEPPDAAPGEGKTVLQTEPTTAWILGGGRCRYARNFFLNLLEPSERTASQIIRHVNARFPGMAKGNVNPGIIDLKVPPAYALDKRRFLDVIGAIYLIESPDRRERRMRELVEKLKQGPDRSVLAGLESFGRPTIRLLEPLLAHPVAAVQFGAARTLARLGEPSALAVLGRFIRDDRSPFQEEAVRAAAELPEGAGAGVVSTGLDTESPAVRIAAYTALRRIAPSRLDFVAQVPGRLELAAVRTRATPFVFVSRQIASRVVVFGDVKIDPPLLVTTPRLLASATRGSDRITLVSKRLGIGAKAVVDLDLAKVVKVMASPPVEVGIGRVRRGLNLAYSDVVGFLDQASRKGALAARIVYEPLQIAAPVMDPFAIGGDTEGDIVIPDR